MVGIGACSLATAALVSALLIACVSQASAQAANPAPRLSPARGKLLFARDCAFCHGRDAAGGESGPDLTRSRLVARDVRGDRIRAVVHDGRVEKGMPPFPGLTIPQANDLIAFIRDQTKQLNSKPGGRRGVDVADLQSGNTEQGKAYFNGAGKCSSCHSPTGDLAGVARRYPAEALLEKFLYPARGRERKPVEAAVKLASGETIAGEVEYVDDFIISIRGADGEHRSWPRESVQAALKDPYAAHQDLLRRYTDADIHNLLAYLADLK